MNEKRKYGWVKHLDFMIIDLICLEAAYFIACHIRFDRSGLMRWNQLYTNINIILIILDLCYVLLRSEYKNILKRSAFTEIQKLILQNIVIWGAAMAYLFITQQSYFFSRFVLLSGVVLSFCLMVFVRCLWKSFVRNRLIKGKNLSYNLIITTRDRGKRMIETFRRRSYNGFNLLGFAIVDAEEGAENIERVPIVCTGDNLLDYARTNVVDEVMINLPEDFAGFDIKELAMTLMGMGITVHIGFDYMDYYELPNSYVERIGGYYFLTTSIKSSNQLPLMIKRFIDILAGLVGCVITGILFIFVAPAIYKASPGKIFFAQERIGKNGRRFKIYKFRSMYPDAEKRKKELMEQNKMEGLMFKVDNDPRIIGSEKGPGKGIGNFIRKTSIDEFPQFLNVLKGDMSLVGTRPPTVDEFEKYDAHHKVRLGMKPGITGLWQVSGRSDITNFEEIVKLDESYIENWSLWLDIKIIFKTVGVVLKHSGAE